MKKIETLGAALILLFSLLLGGYACSSVKKKNAAPKTAPKPPRHVLLVTIDTLRQDRLGCYGNKQIKTPVIDSLAQDGILFSHAFTPAPITLPAHVSIMTGLYPYTHGVVNNGEYHLNESVLTIAQSLQEQGFTTAAFVGAFVLSKQFGLARGFSCYDDELQGKSSTSPSEAMAIYNERKGELVSQAALAWLQEKKPDRFFLWVHFFDPHFSYDPPEPYKTEYSHNLYDGEVAYTDSCLGSLLEGLQEVLDDTMVILVADHGESLGEHRENTHGIFLYDVTMQVPLIIRYPQLGRGLVVNEQVCLLDLFPTILQVLNLPSYSSLQGESLLNFLPQPEGGQESRREAERVFFLETRFPEENFGWSRLQAIRTLDWKYIEAPKPELYDLVHDPAEMNNLINLSPQMVRQMQESYQNLLARLPQAGKENALALDEASRQRLESLGYVRTTPSSQNLASQPPASQPLSPSSSHRDPNQRPDSIGHFDLKNPNDPQDLNHPKDPKDMIEILNRFDQGGAYYEQKNYSEASKAFQEVSDQDPHNLLAHFLLAACYEKTGYLETALAEFQQVASLDPLFINVYNNIGNLQEKQGDFQAAIEAYQTDLRLHPQSALSPNNLGVIYLKLNRFQEAKEQFEKLLTLSPDLSTRIVAHTNLGAAYEMLGLLEPALNEYSQSLSLDPSYLAARMGAGNIYFKTQRSEQAIEEWQKALVINPQLAEAHFNLGCALLGKRRLSEAIGHLEEAVRLEPNLWQASLLLQKLHQQESHKPESPSSESHKQEKLLQEDPVPENPLPEK